MKLLVIGIGGGSPENLFEDVRLSNIHHLMSFGCFGALEGAGRLQKGLEWLCVAASQKKVDVASPKSAMVWEQIEKQGKQAFVVRVPLDFLTHQRFLQPFVKIWKRDLLGRSPISLLTSSRSW